MKWEALSSLDMRPGGEAVKKVMRKKAAARPKKASQEYFQKLAANRGLRTTWASPKPKDKRSSIVLDALNRVLHPRGKQTPWMRGLDYAQKRVDTEQ
jgi:hypothetical protein